MLKFLGMSLLLLAATFTYANQVSKSTTAVETEHFSTAPTALDIMQIMSTYLGGEVTPEKLFDVGVQSNMHIPMQHLQVRFTDTRNDTELSREEIAHILGQSRQNSAHDLILRTINAFVLPSISQEQLIDLFDAAALASMRKPPNYINIEFYDARLGAENTPMGGISGSIPNKVYNLGEQPAKKTSNNNWNDQDIIDYFIANEFVFKPKSSVEFVLPYTTVAKDFTDLNNITRTDLASFQALEPDLDLSFANNKTLFLAHAAVGTEGELRKYIGLLHLKTGTREKADDMRAIYTQLYGQP